MTVAQSGEADRRGLEELEAKRAQLAAQLQSKEAELATNAG